MKFGKFVYLLFSILVCGVFAWAILGLITFCVNPSCCEYDDLQAFMVVASLLFGPIILASFMASHYEKDEELRKDEGSIYTFVGVFAMLALGLTLVLFEKSYTGAIITVWMLLVQLVCLTRSLRIDKSLEHKRLLKYKRMLKKYELRKKNTENVASTSN